MPHKQIPGSAGDWMVRARSDLAIATTPLPENALYEDLCFHAQQAAEKALKAVYQHYEWEFQYTHDLNKLITGLEQRGLDVPERIIETDVLTRYAWESRYPYIGEPVIEEEYGEAVRFARTVVAWAEGLIR